ncbi:putative 25S rRNA (uridine-N(3))-methyltransferase BMT5 [Septoria linicola]|nr:putative 25S rRNA (uridine-N(3))-methyltransferase BMT5 [Septoria linicola]
MAKAKNNKKRKLHSNHAENRKPARPVQRKDAQSASKQQQQPTKPPKVMQPTIPFLAAEDRILLIGEGDFSFAKSIVEEHGCCDVTATSYDSQDDLFAKYNPQAEEHVKYLEEEGQHVLYNVDATKLDKNKPLAKAAADGKYDVVLFNFPHVGGKSTDVNRQVRFNQELLVNFFDTVQRLLAQSGTIVVTLFEGEPYTLWNIRDLGRHTGLEVARSFKFQAEAYPGYSHARTLGNIEGGGGWKGEDRDARSYVFQLKAGAQQNGGKETPKTQAEMQKEMERQRRERLGAGDKRKRAKDDDSDSDDD